MIDFQKFKARRASGSASRVLHSILSISVNLRKFDMSVGPHPSGETCLIVCSDPGRTVGPLRDCATAANYLRRVGFTIYFLRDPTRESFLKHFQYFLCAKTTTTLIYMNLPSATVRADDGTDEVIRLRDGTFSEDDLARALSLAAKPADNKVIIVTESCHTGYSWNLCGTVFNGYKLPGGVLSIASRRNGEKDVDLTSEGSEDAGLFTFYLFRLLNDSQGITVREIQGKMNRLLSRYSQFVMATATSDRLLEDAVLRPWEGRRG